MIPWRKNARTGDGGAKRILIIQLGSLAQFVQALAPARAIREAHLGAHITLLTTETTQALAEQCPYFDKVEADGKPKEPQAITKLIARIRTARFDMIYDLEGSSRTNNYFQGMRPWPPQWSGPVAGASHAYMDATRANLHPLDRYAGQLDVAGVAHDDPLLPDLMWLRTVLRDPPRLSPDYFGIRGRFVLLFPRGAEGEGNRRWPEAKYVELARRIARHGVTPVVLGGPDERNVGAAIAKEEPRAKNLVTRPDIFQVAALAQRAAFAVGDDVDLMHVAAAAGASCLVFLSAGADPEKSGPRGHGGVVAFTAPVLADLSVDQVERQLRNCGVLQQAATA